MMRRSMVLVGSVVSKTWAKIVSRSSWGMVRRVGEPGLGVDGGVWVSLVLLFSVLRVFVRRCRLERQNVAFRFWCLSWSRIPGYCCMASRTGMLEGPEGTEVFRLLFESNTRVGSESQTHLYCQVPFDAEVEGSKNDAHAIQAI